MSGIIRFCVCLSLLTVFFFGHVKAKEVEPVFTSIRVLRSDNRQPLVDAIVKVSPIGVTTNSRIKPLVGFTDGAGRFGFQQDGVVAIIISHLGYKTIYDTLSQPGEYSYSIEILGKDVADVVITGQYNESQTRNSVYNVKVVTVETIKAKGANNLREALQNELNIDLGQDQVFGSSLSINGISGEGIKIMVDGVPLVGRIDGKLDLSQINLANIERIEMVEGPLSVVYGTDAMGGVINIITKTFQQEKVNVGLKGYYESVGQYNIESNMGFAWRKHQIFLHGGRYFFGGYSPMGSNTRFQEWKPKEQYFADAKYVYSGNRFRFAANGAFFREVLINRGSPRQTLQFTPTDTSWTWVGDDVHFLTYRPRVSTSFTYRFKENTRLDALLAYTGFIRFANKYSKNLVSLEQQLVDDPNEQDTSAYHQITFRGTYTMPAWKNRLNFQFGVEVNQEYTIQKRILGGRQEAGDYAAFGSVKFNLAKGLDIQPAMRIIYNTRFRAPLVPSVNVRYTLKDALVLRASYGKGYRAPSLKELFMVFFDSNHSLRGNPELLPENGHIVNGSVEYTQRIKEKHSITYSVTGFWNLIQNKIDWQIFPASGPVLDTFQYFNIKQYATAGGNAGVNYRWDRLQINVAAMITHYKLSNTRVSADPMTFLSPDVMVHASYRIPKAEVNLNVFYKYNGPKPVFSVNNSVQSGTRNAFNMMDVSLSKNFWKDRVQVTVGGKNLIGIKNVAAANIASVGHNFNANAMNVGWGRTFFASLTLNYSR